MFSYFQAQLESEGAFDEEEPTSVPLITTEGIAEALDAKLPDIDIMDMDEDIVIDEFVEPTEELTLEDAKDMWTGTLDTTGKWKKSDDGIKFFLKIFEHNLSSQDLRKRTTCSVNL